MENIAITNEKLMQELASLRQRIAEMEKAESINVRPGDLRQGNENFFYLVTENVPALIAYVNADDLRYRYVNKHYEKFFEKPREAIIGKQVRELIGEENYRFALPYIESVLSGKAASYENIFAGPRGKSWLKVDYMPDVDESGTIKGIFVLIADITERKHAEEALQESEQKFKSLSEKSLAGVYVIQDSTFKYVNSKFARIFGYEVDEMIDKVTVENVVFPEDWPVVNYNIRKRLSGELESLHYEFRIITKNKEVKNVEVYSSRTIYGTSPAVIGTCLDITTRKQAEAAIRRYSDDLTKRVKELNCLYSISEIVRRNDISLRKIFQECASMLSSAYLFPEITACRITWGDHEYGTENFRATQWLQNRAIMVRGEQAGTIEVCYLEERQEKDEGPFLAEERQLLNSVADLLGRSEERKQAEAALQKSRQRFQGLVETLYDWVWELNSRAQYTYVSPQIKNILGYDREEVLGKTPYDLMPPEDAKRIARIVRTLIKERKPMVALENIYIHKDGHLVVLETNGLPFYNAAGKLIGYRGTDRDTTARKHAEEEREKLIAELREALARVKTLSGMLPICSSCKKIRDDKGYWKQIEVYIRDHSEAEFSHGICPECAERLYPGLYKKK